jgi:dTDP-4-dehydrorhamnose reductase
MRALIAGASGLLGTVLAPILIDAGYEVVRHGHRGVSDVFCDLTDRDATIALIDSVSPQVVINLVARTDVDMCERDPHGAYLLNVRPVENMVSAMRDHANAYLIHISTDQLYDSIGPSREDEIRLTNTYALTKYASELAAALMPSTILRTNFFGHSVFPGRKSFSDWLTDSLRDGSPITVFTDVVFNPLSMGTLGAMIGRVLEKRANGVFNLGSRGAMSKADFAFELARIYGLPTHNVKRGLSSEMDLLAYRPKDMSMSCACFETAFDVVLPTLEDEIKDLKRNSDARA